MGDSMYFAFFLGAATFDAAPALQAALFRY